MGTKGNASEAQGPGSEPLSTPQLLAVGLFGRSAGFSTGGATVEDVKLFRQHISPDLRIKAAGGIRSFEQAQAMLDAGAERIGASALAALMEE